MKLDQIRDNIRQKYSDARLLIENGRYANAIYLCGYCIELSLKYAIAARLHWPAYRTEGKLKFLRVHDLDVLVPLTGQEQYIKTLPSWSVAIQWNESRRYEDPALATEQDATDMLGAAKEFAETLCAISL
ncbi:HEPN domain protein [Thiorhodovibrio winogradskyi]|uniref:HEPN domain protein n=1 Tax=Thiorhodovibrio winogradskyi TaxID=77007 RepID=A0ABZ0SD04_9GAMM|nr:HEPN domain-containing protein [Thiorhodovibrio winogradskyi]